MLLNFSNLEGVSHCFIEAENLRYVNIPHRANPFNRENKLLIIGSRTLCAKNNFVGSVLLSLLRIPVLKEKRAPSVEGLLRYLTCLNQMSVVRIWNFSSWKSKQALLRLYIKHFSRSQPPPVKSWIHRFSEQSLLTASRIKTRLENDPVSIFISQDSPVWPKHY